MIGLCSDIREHSPRIGGDALRDILDCRPPRGRISAIDLAVGPDVLPAESPSKVANLLLSAVAEENPTCAHWA